MIRDGKIKVGSDKYKLNYTMRDLKEIDLEYKREVISSNIHDITNFFVEACLINPKLKSDKESLDKLIRWYNRKIKQLRQMGRTYVFGKKIQSVLLHNGADQVKNEFTEIEHNLLDSILKKSKNENVYISFYPGYLININEEGKIRWLFDYRQSIRNY